MTEKKLITPCDKTPPDIQIAGPSQLLVYSCVYTCIQYSNPIEILMTLQLDTQIAS
ncbi:hypothetical protein K449DRAFT_383079 [Hypoxylon sp. EC38]|nr:hypothetical protein K449DRAFT_383079 [Hypoxylon sp. EC38]